MADSRSFGAADEVRRLAREGILAEEFRTADAERRRHLRAGAGAIAGPLLFLRLTRPLELRRGHLRCAVGLQGLAAECLDRYHHDLDAVLDHLFARAVTPIDNLEGWLALRLRPATVDGYRKRRGERGAPQRPRVPRWLADELGHDSWRLELAVAILEWSGNDATAGSSLWPLTSWAERRAAHTGDHTATEAVVSQEVEIVLNAMRRRTTWYEKNVERPIGRKSAPVWIPSRSADGTHAEPEPVVVALHERTDALLNELAARAIELLDIRIGRGQEPDEAVSEVLHAVFGGVPCSDGLDRTPDAGETGPEQVISLIGDPDRLDRIIAVVVTLLSRPPQSPSTENDGSLDRPSERWEG
ncbi:hypothetical protein DMB66_18880 [Actinoplanes sp. ATCC 53533]|uniref:hypothetical protein n=1 Tax=Actinoplanes sp. ATCC 53533 TaxID=1288362 RepID=UPI000F7A1662|nr:hypothetical protein [Actinoplanes sp. ATCC 53533]RSM64713.1 hypothetical protein DMB66_18880 [Actinoplanes sp. ATCC 53533]